MRALGKILDPEDIYEMSDDRVARIAGESEESRSERERFTRQLDALKQSHETCKKFAGLKISGGKSQNNALSVNERRC